MVSVTRCPRCGRVLTAPERAEADQVEVCSEHGAVPPLRYPLEPDQEVLAAVARHSQVPLWLPWPMPPGWQVSGVRWAGWSVPGPVATVLSLTGQNAIALDPEDPLQAEIFLVAEQPGVGLGAHLAGLSGLDAGALIANSEPQLHLTADGHLTPLWALPVSEGDGRAGEVVFVGEAGGVWLWLLAWPASAAILLLSQWELIDLRQPAHTYVVPFAPLSPRLIDPRPASPATPTPTHLIKPPPPRPSDE